MDRASGKVPAELQIDFVLQVDTRTGAVVWRWNPGAHMPCVMVVQGECWHYNGIFWDGADRALVLTAHFLSGFVVVDRDTEALRFAVAQNWPRAPRTRDVALPRCADSPVATRWCGPSHRAQALGGGRYSLFINGCGSKATHNFALCRHMKCPHYWHRRSANFVVEVSCRHGDGVVEGMGNGGRVRYGDALRGRGSAQHAPIESPRLQ